MVLSLLERGHIGTRPNDGFSPKMPQNAAGIRMEPAPSDAVTLIAALSAIHDSGLWDFLAPYGGGFQFRRIGGSPLLSMHSLALALDFDPANNARDLPADQSRFGASAGGREVVRLFGLYGWAWGGDFQKRPDAMHFQFATGV